MCNDVESFKKKLVLFIDQLAQRKFDNFSHLRERAAEAENDLNADKYASKVEALLDVCKSRFADFTAEAENVAFFTSPFTFKDVDSLTVEMQLEAIDLQNNSVLKGRFDDMPAVPSATDMISFWSMLPVEQFGHLRSFAQRFICRFGSTYRCEQSFSAMKIIKNRNRARLADKNLSCLMMLATTDLRPDINKLASAIQPHKSH